jgi:hypothetical protein
MVLEGKKREWPVGGGVGKNHLLLEGAPEEVSFGWQ